MPRCTSSSASASACIADSDVPVKQTSDAPQFGRSQMSTRLPRSASAAASSRTPGESMPNRPPGVITHGRPALARGGAPPQPPRPPPPPNPPAGRPSPRTQRSIRSLLLTACENDILLNVTETTFVVDVDSHWSERPDLFTSVAPAAYRDRVPRVEEVDGEQMWVFDGHVMGRYGAGGVIARDGSKEESDTALYHWSGDQIHEGAYNPQVRLGVMDDCGIDAQVIFPSTIGLGGQDLALVDDEALRRLTVELYNDRQARIQKETNNRLLPLPVMPAWDIAA